MSRREGKPGVCGARKKHQHPEEDPQVLKRIQHPRSAWFHLIKPSSLNLVGFAGSDSIKFRRESVGTELGGDERVELDDRRQRKAQSRNTHKELVTTKPAEQPHQNKSKDQPEDRALEVVVEIVERQ